MKNVSKTERIARRVVAALFGSMYSTQEEFSIHDLGGDEYRIVFSFKDNYCERYVVKNGVPVSCERCSGIDTNAKGLNEIVKKACFKNSRVENSIIYDYLVEYKEKRNRFLNGAMIEKVRAEYEKDPKSAKELYDYDTFDQYMMQEWSDVKYHAWSNKARKKIFSVIRRIMDDGGDVSSTYDVKCGAISYANVPVSENDIPNLRERLLNARNGLNSSMVTDEEIDKIFASSGKVVEMEYGFDVGYLRQHIDPKCYETRLLPAFSIVEEKLSSNGYSSLLGIRIRHGNNAERTAMQYDWKRDEIMMANAIDLGYDARSIAYGLVHELGHRLYYKFATDKQKDEMERAFDSRRTHFSSLKNGDSLVTENGETFVVNRVQNNLIRLVSDRDTVEIEDVALFLKKIVSINGNPFMYEANGIPSNYSLLNKEEFFAECFAAWIFGKFSGDAKKFLDDVFRK